MSVKINLSVAEGGGVGSHSTQSLSIGSAAKVVRMAVRNEYISILTL